MHLVDCFPKIQFSNGDHLGTILNDRRLASGNLWGGIYCCLDIVIREVICLFICGPFPFHLRRSTAHVDMLISPSTFGVDMCVRFITFNSNVNTFTFQKSCAVKQNRNSAMTMFVQILTTPSWFKIFSEDVGVFGFFLPNACNNLEVVFVGDGAKSFTDGGGTALPKMEATEERRDFVGDFAFELEKSNPS